MKATVVYRGHNEMTQVSASLTVESTLQTVQLPRIIELPVGFDQVMLLVADGVDQPYEYMYERESSDAEEEVTCH